MSYCTNCGNELEQNSKFCTECGTPVNEDAAVSQKKPAAPKGELLMSLKPTFVRNLIMLRSIPLVLFAAFFLSFFIAPIIVGLFGFIFGAIGYLIGVLVYLGLLGFGIPFGMVWNTKRTYEETEYKIFDDKVEYSEGFINVSNNVVRMKRIIDVHMNQGYFQKKYELGTISLDMAGGSRNQIKMTDIKKPQEIYRELQNLLAVT